VKFNTALRLGRVSNLPTIATNAMAGMALTGLALNSPALAVSVAAAGLAYTAGMFLNDAFDAPIDAKAQPYRPIPSGLVTRRQVFAWGFGLLAASVILFGATGLWFAGTFWAALAALGLALAIVGYNANHKENPLGPVLMGMCRVVVYCAAALVISHTLPLALALGAGMLLAHVMGLTYIARKEASGSIKNILPYACLLAPLCYGLVLSAQAPHALPFVIMLALADAKAISWCRTGQPANLGRAIPLLIAAICLLDAMLLAAAGQTVLAWIAALGFPLTLRLQKWVRGT
jgi:hypothetical protein